MNDFASVARLIVPDASEVLVPILARYSLLIGNRPPDAVEDAQLLQAVRALEQRLAFEACVYARVEEEFGFAAPAILDDTAAHLWELAEYLESQLPPRRKGGPTPDGRRLLCAAVCAELWCEAHGKVEPYSHKLQNACELYWQACGNPETSSAGRLKNWERFLLRVMREDDEGFREVLLRGTTT